MGVYIKGVTELQLMKVIMNSTEFMPDNFEVIEVNTPHGKLIDADMCKKQVYNGSRTPYNGCPTVIEAEVE